MKKGKKLLTATMLVFSLVTVALGGTITGSKTGSSVSRTGTITGSRTGTITGSRTGTITGSRTVESPTVDVPSQTISNLRISRLALLLINLPW